VSFPVSKVLLIATLSMFVLACSETDSGKNDSAQQPPETAHEAAVKEVETQPVTELDPVHLPENLLDTYRQTCGTCHERGVINAPKTGDATAWSPRMAQGMDALVAHARDGFKAMPPAGLCYSCSDEDYEHLIRFMATPQAEAETAR